MIIIKISLIRCVLYSLINILHIIVFTIPIIVLYGVEIEKSSNNLGIIIFFGLIFFTLAIYPVIFLLYFYFYDKNKNIYITEETGDVVYQQKGEKDIQFNLKDVNKINVCFPFIRITINHYYKIYLNSGSVITTSCLIPIKQLKKQLNFKKEKVETKLWIDDFIKIP